MEQFLARLREIEKRDGQAAMAAATGLHVTTIWRILAGQRDVDGSTLRRLIRTYPELGAYYMSDVMSGVETKQEE